jgi:DNA-binding GntR family transcriptional regulator
LEDILVFFAATTRERLERNVGVPPEEIAGQLKVRAGTRVAVFSSWRSVDGKPFSFSKTYVRLALANQIRDEHLEESSLVELLDIQLNGRLSGAQQLLWATAADEEVALELGVPTGAPVLALGLTYYTADGEPAFYTSSLFRGDRYVHHVRLGRLPV